MSFFFLMRRRPSARPLYWSAVPDAYKSRAMEAPVFAADAVGTGSTMRRALDGAQELVIGMFRAGVEKL